MVDQNSNNFFDKSINPNIIYKEDEIDVAEIFKSILRNKKIVFIICFLSLIFSTYKILNIR